MILSRDVIFLFKFSQCLFITKLQNILCIKSYCTATEYHLGLLKAKLAKYRAQLLEGPKSSGAKVYNGHFCLFKILFKYRVKDLML